MSTTQGFSADDNSTKVLNKSLATLDQDVFNPNTDSDYLSEVATSTEAGDATDVAVYGTKPTPKPTPLFEKNKQKTSSGGVSTTHLEAEYTLEISTESSIKST